MDLKNNKGITLADIAISIVVIFLFGSFLTGLIYNYAISNKAIQRKTIATQYASNILEKLKQVDYDTLIENNSIDAIDKISELNNLLENNNQIEELEGYSVTINIERYCDKEENLEREMLDVLSTAKVTVEYTVGKDTESLEFSTILVKEIEQ